MCCCNSNGNVQDDFVVYGTQFTTPTEYANPFLKGRFRIEMRGLGTLTRKVEWDYLPDGGLKILLAGFVVTPEALFHGEFY